MSLHVYGDALRVGRARIASCWLAVACGLIGCTPSETALEASAGQAMTQSYAPGLLKYFGGPVNPNPQIVQVVWNNTVDTDLNISVPLTSFYQSLAGSTMFDWLDADYNTSRGANSGSHSGQNGTGQRLGRPSFFGRRSLAEPSGVISDAAVQAALGNAVQAGSLPAPTANTVYMISFPRDVTVTKGSLRTCDATQSVFLCGYHSTAAINGVHAKYAVLPDQSGVCLSQCGNNSPFNNTTLIASHELVATMLDPEIGFASGNDYPMGWGVASSASTVLDPEDGSLCSLSGEPLPGTPYVVQDIYDNATGHCIVTKPAGDFALSESRNLVSLHRYTRADVSYTDADAVTISAATVSGTPGPITLSVSGVPTGVAAIFTSTSLVAGGSVTLEFIDQFTAQTPAPDPGRYPITVTAIASGVSHTMTLSLDVNEVPDSFLVSVDRPIMELEAGDPVYGTTTTQVGTQLKSGLPEDLSLAIADLPPGVTASFDSTHVTVPQSTTLRFQATSAAAAGDTWVTVSATGAAGTATVKFVVRVASGPIVYSVTPAHGTVGDQVVIHGNGFSDVMGSTVINFGPYPVTVQSCTTTDCTVKVPPGAGAQHVSVTTLNNLQTSLVSDRDVFTYDGPHVTGMSPTSGPIAGGTYVDLTGTGFIPDVPVGAGHTQVWFGNVQAPYVLCTSSTSCRARSPAVSAAGDVAVSVRVFDASAAAPGVFSYRAHTGLVAVSYSQFFGVGGSVDLDGFAPTGGTTVALSSSNPTLVAVPASVTVQPGFAAANFTATFTPTDHTQSVVITATLDGTSVSTTLVLDPGPPLSIDIPDAALATGASTMARISLNSPAPDSGTSVALASSMPSAIAVPASVVVLGGQQTVLVPLTNLYAGAANQVTLTATSAELTASTSIWVPVDGSCLPKVCGKGRFWSTQDCLCEDGLPR